MLTRQQLTSAVAYNTRVEGRLWARPQLPDAIEKLTGADLVNAVCDLQRAAGLTADGKIGPKTLAALSRAPAASTAHYLLGVDLSGHQDEPWFDKQLFATNPIEFGYIKLTQETFASNKDAVWQDAMLRDMGACVGYYHFADVSESASAQAKKLMDRADKIARGRKMLPPMIDLEWFDDHNSLPPTAFRDWTVRCAAELRALSGVDPVLYIGPNFWRGHLKTALPELGPVHLFVVDYSKPEAPPTLPPGFTTWTFRQYTGSGKLPGYKFGLDLDYFNGTIEDLQVLEC